MRTITNVPSCCMACATAPVAAAFSATCDAPARRSAGACSAPRAVFTAARAPDLAFPANAATCAAKVAKCSTRLDVRLNLVGRPVSLVESMSYSLSSHLSRVHNVPGHRPWLIVLTPVRGRSNAASLSCWSTSGCGSMWSQCVCGCGGWGCVNAHSVLVLHSVYLWFAQDPGLMSWPRYPGSSTRRRWRATPRARQPSNRLRALCLWAGPRRCACPRYPRHRHPPRRRSSLRRPRRFRCPRRLPLRLPRTTARRS